MTQTLYRRSLPTEKTFRLYHGSFEHSLADVSEAGRTPITLAELLEKRLNVASSPTLSQHDKDAWLAQPYIFSGAIAFYEGEFKFCPTFLKDHSRIIERNRITFSETTLNLDSKAEFNNLSGTSFNLEDIKNDPFYGQAPYSKINNVDSVGKSRLLDIFFQESERNLRDEYLKMILGSEEGTEFRLQLPLSITSTVLPVINITTRQRKDEKEATSDLGKLKHLRICNQDIQRGIILGMLGTMCYDPSIGFGSVNPFSQENDLIGVKEE